MGPVTSWKAAKHFRSFDPSDWANLPVPKRQWLVPDLIPMRKVTALYGDGGTGKTLLAMQPWWRVPSVFLFSTWRCVKAAYTGAR